MAAPRGVCGVRWGPLRGAQPTNGAEDSGRRCTIRRMQRVTPDRPWPLLDVAATRRLEQGLAAALPPHALMQRAGLAVARLALALAPHARTIWVACGPGNNGGDGFEAAPHPKRGGKEPGLARLGGGARSPGDGRASPPRARPAGGALA